MSPAWATVNIYCTFDYNEVSVYYEMDGGDTNRPVAFGLNIEASDGANVDAPSYVNPHYWVCPGSIDVNTDANVPAVDSNGVPYGDPCDHLDTLAGPGTSGMTIEVGALFSPPEINPKIDISRKCCILLNYNGLLLFIQDSQAGELFAFEELEAGAAAGGNMTDAFFQAQLLHGGGGVASSDHAHGLGLGERLGDRERPCLEGFPLEHTQRPVPEDRTGRR